MQRRMILLSAAVCTALSASLAQAQVVFSENFDDGLAADRFDTRTLTTVTPGATADFRFNFDYSTYNYVSYASGTNTPLVTPTVQPIPQAPGGGNTLGLRMSIVPIDPLPTGGSTIMQMGALPKAVNVADNFKIEGYMWMNYNGGVGDQFATQGGAGSTEYSVVGLRRSGDGLSGPFAVAANPNSPGYTMTMTGEGGTTQDVRMHNTDAGDDGPAFQKRTGHWFGGARENRYNLATGDFITAGSPAALVVDTPDNLQHSYYRNEVFRNEDGFEIAGTPAKKWVKFEVEQHGRIATYVVNGKAIGVLFNTESFSGTPQFGYFDRFTGGAPNTVDANNGVNNRENQFMLYDNLSVTQMAAPTANTLATGTNYAAFSAGGSYTDNGNQTLSYLELVGPESISVGGTGTLTLGQTLGAVHAIGGASNVITKKVVVAADTSINVVGTAVAGPPLTYTGGVLEFTDITFGANNDIGKQGQGTLKVPHIVAKSLVISDGKLALTGAGPAHASKITALDVGYASTTQIDFGRTVVAIDYVRRTSSANTALTNSPLVAIQNRLNTGYAADGSGLPQWNGNGIITSAPEVLGEGFVDPSNIYVVRVFEASSIGVTGPVTWGATGLTIDDSTVIFGFSFKADSNFDQTINFSDLLVLAQNYNATGLDTLTSWAKGDSNGDGNVNFSDLLVVAQLYGRTVGAPAAMISAEAFAADWALAQSMVPEPASLSLLGLGAATLLRRRRA